MSCFWFGLHIDIWLKSGVRTKLTMANNGTRYDLRTNVRLPTKIHQRHDNHVERNLNPMNSSVNRWGRAWSPKSRPEATPTSPPETTDPNNKKPPHPHEIGIFHKVNICHVCEKYTVIELKRGESASRKEEAMRARFQCNLCDKSFDIGIMLYDPREVPGVTLYKEEDRFVPPCAFPDCSPMPPVLDKLTHQV